MVTTDRDALVTAAERLRDLAADLDQRGFSARVLVTNDTRSPAGMSGMTRGGLTRGMLTGRTGSHTSVPCRTARQSSWFALTARSPR